MRHDCFRHPVTILAGLGIPAKVHGAKEAYAWLNDWPPSKRNPTHAIALNACRAALAGEIDVEIARGTLVDFARRANLLAPDTEAIVAAGGGAVLPGPHIEATSSTQPEGRELGRVVPGP